MIELRRRPSILRAAILLTASVALSGAAPTAAHSPDPSLSGGLFGQDQRLLFRWRSGSEPPAAIKTAIRAAADDSNASRASQAATFVYDSIGSNLIGYGTGTCGVNGIGCFTRTAPTGFTMWLREHGRPFDWGTLRWCQMQSVPTNGCYDAETIALDEFGHVEILNHHVNFADESDYTDAVVQTFSRTRPKTGWNMHVYGVCDTATLQIRYDVPTLSSPYSTCLDLSTVLTLSISDTSIPYGRARRYHRLPEGDHEHRVRTVEREPDRQADGPSPAAGDRFLDLDEPRRRSHPPRPPARTSPASGCMPPPISARCSPRRPMRASAAIRARPSA